MSIFDDDTSFDAHTGNDLNDPGCDIDYYAVLNVPKNATSDEINRAYKQRSLIFHPDRHLDEEDKKEASKIFIIIKEAHEILIDPKTRAIYDILGVRGVKLQGWELSTHSTSPENIRKEYEFLQRLHENEIELQRVNPETNFVVRSSIAGLFQNDSLEIFTLLGMNIGQTVDCRLTTLDRIGCTGRVSFNEKGLGNGSMQISYKRAFFNSSHIENNFEIAPNHVMYSTKFSIDCLSDAKKWYSWLNGITILCEPSIKYIILNETFDMALIPTIVFPLSQNNQGAISFNVGNKRFWSMTITYIHNELSRPKFVANFTLSPISPTLRIAYHKRYPQNDQRYEGNCTFSFTPLTIQPSITVEKTLTKYSKIGMKIQFSFPAFFLQVCIRIRTSLNNYEFRLVFCENSDEIIPAGLSLALSCLAIKASWLIIRKKLPKIMRIFEGENVNEMGIELKKKQAQKATNLMRQTAEKIAKEEQTKGGLVIVEAKFGQMVNDLPGSEYYPMAGEKLIDVSIPLQAMVNDSQLRVYSGKDLPGFYDPCPEEPKILKVVYRFQNRLHNVTIKEDELLVIPMKAHSIVLN